MYIRVDLRRSVLLRVSRAGFHIVALLCLPWVNLHSGLLLVFALMVAASLERCFRGGFRQPRAILFIDGAPRLLFEDRVLEVELQEYVYCTSFLQLLYFRRRQVSGDQLFCVVILPDSSGARNRRCLRTLLRWHALAPPTRQGAVNNEMDPA